MRIPAATCTLCLLERASPGQGLYLNFHRTIHVSSTQQNDVGTTYRQNWCQQNDVVSRGELGVRDALRGLNLTVVMDTGYDPVFMEYNADQEAFVGGFLLDLLSAVAERGGFEVIPVAVEHPDLAGGETWTAWLLNVLWRADLTAVWFGDTASRRVSGALFPFWFMDISQQIATHAATSGPCFYDGVFNWLKPFTWQVWVTILAGTVFTALLVWIFERRCNMRMFPGPRSDKSPWWGTGRSLYYGGILFTQSGNWHPVTPVGRLYSWSWSVVVMVVIATYSAELTSSLIRDSRVDTEIDSAEDANQKRARVCLERGTASVDVTRLLYPRIEQVEVDLEDMFAAVRRGDCEAVIAGVAEFDQWLVSKDYNAECDMAIVGPIFKRWGGSYVVAQDGTVLCSTLVSRSVAALMTELAEEDHITTMWNDLLARTATSTCPKAAMERDPSHTPMGLSDLSGVFLVNLVFVVVVMTVYAFSRQPRVRETVHHGLETVHHGLELAHAASEPWIESHRRSVRSMTLAPRSSVGSNDSSQD